MLKHLHITVLTDFQLAFPCLHLKFLSFTEIQIIKWFPTFPCKFHGSPPHIKAFFWSHFVCFHPVVCFSVLLFLLLCLPSPSVLNVNPFALACQCVFRAGLTFFQDCVDSAWMDVSVSATFFIEKREEHKLMICIGLKHLLYLCTQVEKSTRALWQTKT